MGSNIRTLGNCEERTIDMIYLNSTRYYDCASASQLLDLSIADEMWLRNRSVTLVFQDEHEAWREIEAVSYQALAEMCGRKGKSGTNFLNWLIGEEERVTREECGEHFSYAIRREKMGIKELAQAVLQRIFWQRLYEGNEEKSSKDDSSLNTPDEEISLEDFCNLCKKINEVFSDQGIDKETSVSLIEELAGEFKIITSAKIKSGTRMDIEIPLTVRL